MDNRQWKDMFEIAKQYYKENGNLLVPGKYVNADNIKIGYWIGRQRKDYKANILSKEKILLLEEIGMVWLVYDYEWMKNYSLAVAYYEEIGNLVISIDYKTKDGVPLGGWIKHQRKRYKENKISEREISLLNKIGMVWKIRE